MSKTDRVTPATVAQLRQALTGIAFDTKTPYGGYRTSPSDRFTFSRLGRIADVNPDANTATIFWMDQMGTRDEIPISHPYLGLRGHIMAMPEINSLVIVDFLHGIRPYISKYLPFNYQTMVDLTQFPEKIEDFNYATEQFIKTHVELRNDYDVTSLTGQEIRQLRDLEIDTRVARSRLEQNSINKPLLECGEISLSSVEGAEVRLNEDLVLTDMNQDEIILRASDNSIEVTCMQLLTHTDWGNVVEGQVKRPFGIMEPRRKNFININTDPFKDPNGTSKPDALDALVDPQLDRLWVAVSRNGRVDMPDDELQNKDFELIYQYRVNKQMAFVERLVACNEYSDNSLWTAGQNNLIELPIDEQFDINKLQVERSDDPKTGLTTFNITSKTQHIDTCIDINPFRPIETRFVTIRNQNEQESFALQKDSLFNHLNELMGLNKQFFGKLYQDIVEQVNIDPLRNAQVVDQLKSKLATEQTADTIQEADRGTDFDLSDFDDTADDPPTDSQLRDLKAKLQGKIAGDQLGFISSDDIINQSFPSAGIDSSTGQPPLLPPLGSLWRFSTGTLVDGHDRMIKDSFSFERVSMQMRHQSGMFMNIDRRGSMNLNVANLLLNTVGMSFYSGFAHRKNYEYKVADKYGTGGSDDGPSQLDKKIYLPEPIPINTKSHAGRVLNIKQEQQKDSDNHVIDKGSDPRDREPSKDKKALAFKRTDIGQIPSTPDPIIPPPEAPALGNTPKDTNNDGDADNDDNANTGRGLTRGDVAGSAPGSSGPVSPPTGGSDISPAGSSSSGTGSDPSGSNSSSGSIFGPSIQLTDQLQAEKPKGSTPIRFLNEFQIKIPLTAKIKPSNDIVDPAIIGYDKPRTKELSLYSFQTDKKVYEQQSNGEVLKNETIDWDMMARPDPYIEITGANLIDRDGMIIRSSMTQEAIGFDFSLNLDGEVATTAIDQDANIDATHNNIYQRFNAGFIEYGLAYKIKRQDEDVEVRLNAENSGTVNPNLNPNDVLRKDETKLDKVRRQAIVRRDYKRLGHISFMVNVKDDEGIKSEVKTPKEIEKEPKHKKVEDRMLRSPAENLPEDPDVTMDMGGVVDGNHTEAVEEAIGFKNKKLHFRLKKTLNIADISQYQDAINQILHGNGAAVDSIGIDLANQAAAANADFEKIEETLLACIDALDKIAVQIVGPFYENNLTEGPTINSHQVVYNKNVLIANARRAAERTQNLQEQQKLDALIYARHSLANAFSQIFPNSTDPIEIAAGNRSISPGDFFPVNPPITGSGSSTTVPNGFGGNGLPFPIGFSKNPAAANQVGTALIDHGDDPRFPSGAILGRNGNCIAGQGAFSDGQYRNPSTGKVVKGSAFAGGATGGSCTIGTNGAVIGPEETPHFMQLGPLGFLERRPIRVPVGTVIGPAGFISSYPNSDDPNSPNNNPPIGRGLFPSIKPEIVLEKNTVTAQIVNTAIEQPRFLDLPVTSAPGAFGSSGGLSAGVVGGLPPTSATPNASNSSLFPNLNDPTQSDGSGAASTEPDQTIVDIDRAGNWECRASASGTTQVIINPIAQLQLGHVIDKDDQNSITDARSLKGPLSQARIHLKNGTSLDLDAAGNFIGYAVNDFFVKANVNGEIRSYGDLNIISDERNVTLQAKGNPPLGIGVSGDLSGGPTTTPQAEIVLGRLEHRGGVNEGSAIKNVFDKETRAAMVRHISPTDRSVFALDADGNSITETTIDKTILLRTPKAEIQCGLVVDITPTGVTNAMDLFNSQERIRLQTTPQTNLIIDDAGNIILHAAENIFLDAANPNSLIEIDSGGYINVNAESGALSLAANLNVTTTSVSGSIFETALTGGIQTAASTYQNQQSLDLFYIESTNKFVLLTNGPSSPTVAQLGIGEVSDVNPTTNLATTPQISDFGNHIFATTRLYQNGNHLIPTREFTFDERNNAIISTTQNNTTTALVSPEGSIQLGRVVDILGGGNTSVVNSEEGNPDLFRIILANGAKIEIDNAGNAIVKVPGKILLKSGGDIDIESDANINIKAPNGNVTITTQSGTPPTNPF